MNPNIALSGFAALGVSPEICNRLRNADITPPTPIQEAAMPLANEGYDVVGIAQTGTGKTLAFGLPIKARLRGDQAALVLAPTRELALQITDSLKKLDLKCCLVVGGAPMNKQVRNLKSRPQVIVATPGRLIDHLDQGTVNLDRVDIVVLDEADRMLDMGFAPAIKRILDHTPRERQTMLFSATMPASIRKLADEYLYKPQTVEVARSGSTAEGVRQELVVVAHEAKRDRLAEHLDRSSGPVLVFARTRHGARKLAKVVRAFGHEAAELHSDRTLNQRRAAMHRFKTGEARVLVATDIAARGIDVKEIELVINFDLPQCAEDYIHRIGRTGRAGAEGMAVTFATPEQRRDVRDIEKLLGNPIPRSSGSMELDTSDQPVRPQRRNGKRRPSAEKPEPRSHDENTKPAFKPNRKKSRPRSFAPAGAGRNGR